MLVSDVPAVVCSNPSAAAIRPPGVVMISQTISHHKITEQLGVGVRPVSAQMLWNYFAANKRVTA